MSHFTVLVIGDNPEEQLEPFSEELRVPIYKVGEVSDEERDSFIKYYYKKSDLFSGETDEDIPLNWEVFKSCTKMKAALGILTLTRKIRRKFGVNILPIILNQNGIGMYSVVGGRV